MAKPVVLVVMDGVGWTDKDNGNAVMHAYKPQIEELMTKWPHTTIKASGVAVGLPSDADMGNSEVGHNALGCGQIYSQGAKLVNESIESGDIYKASAWVGAVDYLKEHNGKLHFVGLLSDGNVHSNISHLIAMIKEAKKEGVKEVRVHALLDGRDVPETSALQYVDQLEEVFKELNDDTLHGGSNASYAIRFAASFKDIRVVLSGMSDLAQMKDNVSFMKEFKPFTEEEFTAVEKVAEAFHSHHMIPCTGCHYCVEENHCPKNIRIPDIFSTYNTKKTFGDWNADYYYNIVTSNGHAKASECLKCGLCEKVCPQHLEIRNLLEEAVKEFEK